MTDIRLVQNTQFPRYSVTVDWRLLPDGTLDIADSLATAAIVALGTDRLAEDDDILPHPDSTDRHGWWGDLDAEEVWNAWPIGSRLWLLKRDKIVGPSAYQGATTVRVETYIREALQPLIDRRIASSIDVTVSRVADSRIDALVRISRGPDRAVDLRYDVLWDGILEEGIGNLPDIGTPRQP